jgi:hypothetical protein
LSTIRTGERRREYSEFRTYSPMSDSVISRISMADARGQEFWVEVPGEGREYRKAKAEALADIMEAIDTGLAPGKVVRTA